MKLFDQGERDGIWTWHRINRLFNWLPLAALIEKKIICMHGGIGRSINHVEQIENIQRPIPMEAGSIVLMDLLWLVLSCIIACLGPYCVLDINSMKCPSLGPILQRMTAWRDCGQMLEVLD